MRTLTIIMGSLLLLGLSGCQHLNLLTTKPDQQSPSSATDASSTPTSQNTAAVRNFLSQQFGQASIQDYPAACLAQSRLHQAIVVGQVIDTPRYAMITLAKPQQLTQAMSGELCIINKISHHIEITAVHDLRFITPAPRPSDADPAQ